jgi:hypothetical protein
MKLFSTMLAAAFVAGSCTVAMAQAGGASGAGGAAAADSTTQGTMKDPDKNPTGPGANPAAGNSAAPTARTVPSGMAPASGGGLQTAPASNTRADSPAKPAGTKDNTGAQTGSGGSK